MNLKQVHREAMKLMQEAIVLQEMEKYKEAIALFEKAFALEKGAALSLISDYDREPTRGILFRSAASLALDCKQYRDAEKLVTQGLAGEPTDDIASELRNLYEDIDKNNEK